MNAAAIAIVPDEGQEHAAPVSVADAPEANPVGVAVRAMRGRWRAALGGGALLGGLLAVGGYLSGVQLYESQAILRVFPQESNILYATGDDSVLKTFDSFVKAETSYVASHQVMGRAVELLSATRPDLAAGLSVADLTGSIEIRRNDSLIVLRTLSRDTSFAAEKLEAVVAAYMALNTEADDARSSVRLTELHEREEELVTRLEELRADQLDVGGEFGASAITKAHIEKVAQIDALAGRFSEIGATLAALESADGSASADAADQEIMRATLLDRTMGELAAQRSLVMSELVQLRSNFESHSNPRFLQRERSLLEEVAVVDRALSDRREQIRVLGQTGALTDAGSGAADTNIAEIRGLYERVEAQLETARLEARDLNFRRIELDRIEREIQQAEELLGETRRALEVIRLESGRALPGFTVLMSPPTRPLEPAEDSSKMLAAGGFAGGGMLALLIALVLGFTERRVRFAETLTPVEHRVSVIQVSAADDADALAADRLRNELQLQPLRRPRLVNKAPVIAVARAETGGTTGLARSLAESYARSRMRVLFIEADLGLVSDRNAEPGWSDMLSGCKVDLPPADEAWGLWEVSAGTADALNDRAVSAPMVRRAVEDLARSVDVIILSAGSLDERLSCQFLLSAADVGVLALRPKDRKSTVLSQIDRFDSLPRNGSVAVMRNALPGDPWLAVRT
ncbi:hypothetical protein [Histidinibacterium lentulum]|uniref:Uncharacterized protein n=1 Tax=Histidinibacterium lentulum TaxID=2480588 RepID=A0A3N2RA39_9RHOB|nr:hypothetical protein [Histidinibacterium lentulum]ROU04339.1 hypothetical protein EAT49_02830 [Histidinibacterium lentulum]